MMFPGDCFFNCSQDQVVFFYLHFCHFYINFFFFLTMRLFFLLGHFFTQEKRKKQKHFQENSFSQDISLFIFLVIFFFWKLKFSQNSFLCFSRIFCLFVCLFSQNQVVFLPGHFFSQDFFFFWWNFFSKCILTYFFPPIFGTE